MRDTVKTHRSAVSGPLTRQQCAERALQACAARRIERAAELAAEREFWKWLPTVQRGLVVFDKRALRRP